MVARKTAFRASTWCGDPHRHARGVTSSGSYATAVTYAAIAILALPHAALLGLRRERRHQSRRNRPHKRRVAHSALARVPPGAMALLSAMSTRQREEYPPQVERAIAEAEREDLSFLTEPPLKNTPWVTGYKPPMPIAKGRIAKPRGMNKLEADYSGTLFARRSVGEVAWYLYEGITLKLADDCRYTVDFAVMLKSGELQMHEVKGPHRREDSIIKLRVAARLFPLGFS